MLAKLHYYATWALAVIALMLLTVCVLMFVPMNYSPTVHGDDYSYAEQLYEQVRQVPCSDHNAPGLKRIIEQRLDCYAGSDDLRVRLSNCIPTYTTELVAFARDNIHSSPMLGRFVSEAEACPVVFSICRGTDNLTVEECTVMEEQCVEYMLDNYWRGSSTLGFFK